MKKCLYRFLLLLSLLSTTTVSAQEINLDQFYTSSDSHSALSVSTSEEIQSIYENYIKEHNINETENTHKQFVYEYNFFLEKLKRSGLIFSGDEISRYLNSIKDHILDGHKKQGDIHVYLANFESLNAFTNDFGNIYFNVGAVARLESEEELAVILAHEIAHVLLRHSFKMEDMGGHFDDRELAEIDEISEFERHKFSQHQELEADSLAYILLSGTKYQLTNLDPLFSKLKESQNPFFSTSIYLKDLTLTNFGTDYLNKMDSLVISEELFNSIENQDTLNTHPSVEERKELYRKIGLAKPDEITLHNNVQFKKLRLLASHVVANTLMMEEKYVDALYLFGQLRLAYPEDNYLLKQWLKCQMLVVQSKYAQEENPIVNTYGESCTDTSYLRFRRGILSIPPLEMNMITIRNLQYTKKAFDISYVDRLLHISYQFLYLQNPSMIRFWNKQLIMIKEYLPKSDQLVLPLLTTERHEHYKDLQKRGFIRVDSSIRDTTLLYEFIDSFSDYPNFNDAISYYRKERDKHESMLTIDQVAIDFDPDVLFKVLKHTKTHLYKEEIHGEPNIPNSTNSAFLHSDTYVYKKIGNRMELDIEQSLQVHDSIIRILDMDSSFRVNISNLNIGESRVSVRDNYVHYLLINWLSSSLRFSDLRYSSADEEITNYIESMNIRYLVFDINVLKCKKSNSGYKSLHYRLYFDTEAKGVAYVRKIASKKKPTQKYLKYYFLP